MVGARQENVVGDTARTFANRLEIEPCHAIAFALHVHRTLVDDENEVRPLMAVCDAMEYRQQRALGGGIRRSQVHRRLLQGAQAPVRR